MDNMYDGVDMTAVMFGANARHVPAWLYVQNQGPGMVSIVGASRVANLAAAHPLRYGSDRAHQLVIGEIVIRPHVVIATDARRGDGLAALTGDHNLREILAQGEILFGTPPEGLR